MKSRVLSSLAAVALVAGGLFAAPNPVAAISTGDGCTHPNSLTITGAVGTIPSGSKITVSVSGVPDAIYMALFESTKWVLEVGPTADLGGDQTAFPLSIVDREVQPLTLTLPQIDENYGRLVYPGNIYVGDPLVGNAFAELYLQVGPYCGSAKFQISRTLPTASSPTVSPVMSAPATATPSVVPSATPSATTVAPIEPTVSPEVSAPAPADSGVGLWLGVIVLVALALLFFALWLRRRRRR